MPVGIGLALALAVLILFSFRTGTSGSFEFGTTLRGILAAMGLGEPVEQQAIVELRLWRTLVAVGVGAALALSGALLQGLFRNSLASPSVIGVTAGASLGASIAILIVGGYGSDVLFEYSTWLAPYLVTLFAFIGAFGVATVVTSVASSGGRLSVPTLLLTGVAINVCLGSVIAAIQSLVLVDSYGIAQALIMWTFGSLTDRPTYHVPLIWSCLALAAAVIPFVAVELDLFAGGEDDAQSLGVNTSRVKLLVLMAASIAAAGAVAAAGPIAFIGLVVPHLLRLLTGPSHRSLLILSVLGGAVFLLGADYANRLFLGPARLQPGVVMSLFGGPLFLYLLLRGRKEMQTW